jgi:hypothetical protein
MPLRGNIINLLQRINRVNTHFFEIAHASSDIMTGRAAGECFGLERILLDNCSSSLAESFWLYEFFESMIQI